MMSTNLKHQKNTANKRGDTPSYVDRFSFEGLTSAPGGPLLCLWGFYGKSGGQIVLAAAVFLFMLHRVSLAAQVRDAYYAHSVRTDQTGVIAPWSQTQNGPLDTRIRIAVEVLKRYPWVDSGKAVMAAPDFIYNSHWSIQEDGTILIPPTNDWMCGDLSQRAWSIIKGLTAYYQYSGDPIAFVYIPLTADYILDYAQTSEEHDWPRFPIATPTSGKAYGKCIQEARNQLDLCAVIGTEILRAYKLTGKERYLEAARRWGDLFARKCNLDPSMPPWNRYTHPEGVGWSDELTGSTTLILEFLDELIAMGYTGENRRIVQARDAGSRYVRTLLETRWLENDTWGRNYWDWDNPVLCGIVSMCGDYIMKNPQDFPGWRTDLRNILTLIFHRNGTDPSSCGDVYHGAWAFPESSTCCGTSLSYNQYTAAPTLLRFGVLADDDRILEIGRRMLIMATYDSRENGVVYDGLFGQQVATKEWSNLAHPWPLCQTLEAMAWTPELFGPKRENHIMRSTSVVNSVIYEKNRIEYTTFDAPEKTMDVLRLSFPPSAILADGKPLPHVFSLNQNGYTVRPLPDGDFLVQIRHDRARSVAVIGMDDPQEQVDDKELTFPGGWKEVSDSNAFGGTLRVASRKGAEMTFAFRGNQIRLLGKVGPTGGQADVYLDGRKQMTLIDSWNPAVRYRQQLYSASGLPNSEHEIRVVLKGKGNLISKGTEIALDSIQFSNASAEPDFGSGGGPTGAQRMIFGYPHRQDYVDSRGRTWRPATEWVIRSGYGRDTVKEAWWTRRRSMYIGNTDDPELYRYGAHGQEFWVNLTVGPGTYYVTLKFAETPLHWFLERTQNNQRISHTISAWLNGNQVLSGLNIEKAAGGLFLAVDKTFTDIEPQNGIIEVRLKGEDEQGAILQALELGPMSERPQQRQGK